MYLGLSSCGIDVKGPLANAIVKVYTLDASKANFKGDLIATASTNGKATISGLSLPFPLNPPYIMEFTTGANTTDITTGVAPVITTLRIIITQDLLDNGAQIYATPLTSMAVDIAILKAGVSSAQFATALDTAQAQVKSTLVLAWTTQ